MTKLNLEEIKKKIKDVQYLYLPSAPLLTICVIVLNNGFTFVGSSACLCESYYSKEKGQDISYNDAFTKLLEAEAYLNKG